MAAVVALQRGAQERPRSFGGGGAGGEQVDGEEVGRGGGGGGGGGGEQPFKKAFNSLEICKN
jgi:hypothetical protein